MPTANNTLLEDMLALGGSLLGNLADARSELKAQTKNRAGELVRQFDLVTREEFDAAFAMLSKARAMQEELHDRLVAIETHLNLKSGKTASAKSAQKASAKSAQKASTKTKVNLPSVKKHKSSAKRK